MLMSTERFYHFAHLLHILKQSLHVFLFFRFFFFFLFLFFCFFFHVFPHVYIPGQGQTTHCGQNFDDNRKAFSLCPYVASFKMVSSKSDFIHLCNDFIHVYSPRTRAYNPLGTSFDVTRSPYHFAHLLQV